LDNASESVDFFSDALPDDLGEILDAHLHGFSLADVL
jgi:hypothetical protein